jgi:hypothetical protein
MSALMLDHRSLLAKASLALVGIASLVSPGCYTGEIGGTTEIAESGDAAFDRADLPETFRRVVIGRIYQHENWTLPGADTYQVEKYTDLKERRIAYVCDTLVKLRPTYVSGLLRLDADEALTDEQKAVYKGIAHCVKKNVDTHPVRFDIVLNAKHYTEDAPDEATGREWLKARIDGLQADLHPDLWFFDFYSVPFDDGNDGYRPWHEDVMQAGIKRIHEKGGLVGGNVWGMKAPPGSDFAALDNFDRKKGCVDGFDVIKKQAAALRDELPLLMHIENNPQNPGTHGLKWIERGPGYRRAVLKHHAKGQDRVGYSYMYPVFFPLQIVESDPVRMEAYDASQDGDMLDRMKDLMNSEANRGNATATGEENAGRSCEPDSAVDARFFDARFYLDLYPDLKNAFGDDLEAAKKHWRQYGRHEGRMASPVFHTLYYRMVNPDVDAAYGGDHLAVVHHWTQYGIGEARSSSLVFDLDFYLTHHPDLVEAFGEMNYGQALQHYLDYGLNEGRRASAALDPAWYLSTNPDVAAVYGANNYRGAIIHYLVYGYAEGRQGAP